MNKRAHKLRAIERMPRHNQARSSSSAPTQTVWPSSMRRHTAARQPSLPLNMLQHQGREWLSPPFYSLFPVCVIASTPLFGFCSHTHTQAFCNWPSPSQVSLNRLFSLLSFELPPSLSLSHFLSCLLCVRIHWGFTRIELPTGLSNTMSDGRGAVRRNQWADVIS